MKSSRAISIERELETLEKVGDLIEHFEPHSIILEEAGTGSRRSGRLRLLLATIHNRAVWAGIRTCDIPSTRIKAAFRALGASTKYEIAQAIAKQLPELAPRLPRFRKPWMTEDYRMAIFDAAALALTYFHSRKKRTDRRA